MKTQKKIEEQENYSNKLLIQKLENKGFESLSLDEMAYIAQSINFESDYKKQTGNKFPYKTKVYDRLHHSNYNLKWGNKIVPNKVSSVIANPIQMFFNLLEQGSVQKVNEFLKLNAKYYDELRLCSDINKKSPLHVTCKNSNVNLTELLLKKQFTVLARDKFMKTPLHYAVQTGNPSLTSLLLKYKADILSRDNNGRTCLHYAMSSNSPSLIALLLSENKNLIKMLDSYNRTVLHYLIWTESPESISIFNLLLNSKIDINAIDFDGLTALHYASESGKSKLIPYLIKSGANLDLKEYRTGRTAIELAANDYIRQIIIVNASKDYVSTIGDRLKLKLTGISVDPKKELEDEREERLNNKRGRQLTQIKTTNEIKRDTVISAEEMQKEKLISLLKGIQETGLKSMKHISNPQLYTGSWIENISSFEEFKEKLNSLPKNEAILSIYNILNPLDAKNTKNIISKLDNLDGVDEAKLKEYLSFLENKHSNKDLYKYSKNIDLAEYSNNDEVKNNRDFNNDFKLKEEISKHIDEILQVKFSNLMEEHNKSATATNLNENNEYTLEIEKELLNKISKLESKYESYQDVLENTQYQEKLNNMKIFELKDKIECLKSEIESINQTTNIKSPLFKIIRNRSEEGVNNYTKLNLDEELSVYLFIKQIEKNYFSLEDILTKYDTDCDYHILKHEFSNLLDDLKIPLNIRAKLFNSCGFSSTNYKTSIDKIIRIIQNKQCNTSKIANELLFKISVNLLLKRIKKNEIIDYFTNLLEYPLFNTSNVESTENIEILLNFEEFDKLLIELDVITKPEISNLFCCFVTNKEKLINFKDIIDEILLRIDLVEETNLVEINKYLNDVDRLIETKEFINTITQTKTEIKNNDEKKINNLNEEKLNQHINEYVEGNLIPEEDEELINSSNHHKEEVPFQTTSDNINNENNEVLDSVSDNIQIDNLLIEKENSLHTTIIDEVSQDNISNKNKKTTKSEINKVIKGELKIQIKSIDNLKLPSSIKHGKVFLNLNLNSTLNDNNNGLNSKEVDICSLNGIFKAQFNWAARIPLINKNLSEIGSFFNIIALMSKDGSSLKLGETKVNWTSSLKEENLNKFSIDDQFELRNKRNIIIGKIGVMIKFIKAGTKESFYDDEGNQLK